MSAPAPPTSPPSSPRTATSPRSTSPGQPEIDLSRQPAGSGFAYGDSYYELRGRGREATLTAAGTLDAVPRRRPARRAAADLRRAAVSPSPCSPTAPSACASTHDGAPSRSSTSASGPQEVDGGVRLVLRGGSVARRAFREADDDRLVADNGTELAAAMPPIRSTGSFQLDGLFRVAPGRRPVRRMRDRRAPIRWRRKAPSRTSSAPGPKPRPAGSSALRPALGRFVDGESDVERFLSLQAATTLARRRRRAVPRCAAPTGASLEIDGERPAFEDGGSCRH